MALRRTLLLLAFSGLALSAVAAEPSTLYRLTRSGCPAKVWKEGAWSSAELPWKPGDQASSWPGKGRKNVLFFEHEGAIFATEKRCWTRVAKNAGNPRQVAAPSPVTPIKRTFGFGYLGWQEPTRLTRTSDSAAFPLQSFQSEWSLEYGRELSHFGNGTLGILGGLHFGSSSIMTSSRDETALAGLNYRTTNALAFGGWLGPELSWAPGGRESRVGLLIPVLYRKTNWPDVSSGGQNYRIGETSKFLFGALLTYGLRRESWELHARMGYLGGSSSLGWMVGISRAWFE